MFLETQLSCHKGPWLDTVLEDCMIDKDVLAQGNLKLYAIAEPGDVQSAVIINSRTKTILAVGTVVQYQGMGYASTLVEYVAESEGTLRCSADIPPKLESILLGRGFLYSDGYYIYK